MLLQLLPFLGLRRRDEVDDVAGQQAQVPVVQVAVALAVATRRSGAECGRCLAHGVGTGTGVRPVDR
jgi:hypothetical protein